MPLKDYNKQIEYQRNLYKRNRLLYLKQKKEYNLLYPWKATLHGINQRCNNPKNLRYKDYGGRGIKCLITEEELKELWFRDKAYEMKKPSINRKDNDGNYTFKNCEYIELGFNSAERNKRILSKRILQFDLNSKFIKEFNSIREAARETQQFASNISSCLRGLTKTANNFIFKYKEK
jgi:hypothetical protein